DSAPSTPVKSKAPMKKRRSPSPEWPVSPFGMEYSEQMLERVTAFSRMCDEKSNRFGFTQTPKSVRWGLQETGLDDVLCYNGHPVIFFLVGEVENASFFDEHKNPQKYVRIAVKPMFHADLAAAHNLLKVYSHNVKKRDDLQYGVVEAARRQAKRTRTSKTTEAYEFRNVFDASEKYGPKSIMPTLSAWDIMYRDLVLVECKLVRFRVDAETGKAVYNSGWVSWRARYDIVSVCRLQQGTDDVDSPSENDENVPVM
ncbi:hypothetical protein C8Q70DRAFT_909605, partial [Cubamyces menziesii]